MSVDYTVGQKLGDYEILGVLGAGGMGKVYKVRNTISDRVEAMKILLPNLADQKDLADRFLREIKLLASLNHPNIAALRTALTLDNQLVMIMEYVDGVTLASRLQQGPVPVADAVYYIDQVLAALVYAHQMNVVHRDIKPGNMMLTQQGVVKLMDFGIARPGNEAGMTITGTTLGSLNYMSPEQVKGESVDARSDLYSVGLSLYEILTGRLPFRGDSGYSLMVAQLQQLPEPPIVLRPELPQALERHHSDGPREGAGEAVPVGDRFTECAENRAAARRGPDGCGPLRRAFRDHDFHGSHGGGDGALRSAAHCAGASANAARDRRGSSFRFRSGHSDAATAARCAEKPSRPVHGAWRSLSRGDARGCRSLRAAPCEDAGRRRFDDSQRSPQRRQRSQLLSPPNPLRLLRRRCLPQPNRPLLRRRRSKLPQRKLPPMLPQRRLPPKRRRKLLPKPRP